MTSGPSSCARPATSSSYRRHSIIATSRARCATRMFSIMRSRTRSSVSRSPGIGPEAGRPASSSHWQDSDDSDRAHHLQELVGELEGDLLRAGRGLAGKLVQGSDEIAAGQPIERHECGRQRAAVIEEVVDRPADAELIAGEGRQWRGGRILRRRRQPRYRRQRYRLKDRQTIANELRPQVELYAVVEIIQPGPEVARQAKCLQILEPARAPVVGRQLKCFIEFASAT